MDFARSDDARVQAQLDRLPKASAAGDILTLDRIRTLCSRLGNPQDQLPPVFHVAGTNGKGSTVAWLRAAIEAMGGTVHAYTSPHLVRFNERVRISGRLIEDRELGPLLEQVIDAGDGLEVSFFEVATAAAFIAFARAPADATLVEVGLGGRLDATNLVTPVVTGIAALGIDHAHILGDTIEQIAFEKAGIAKPHVPLVVAFQFERAAEAVIAARAAEVGAPLIRYGWEYSVDQDHGPKNYNDRFGAVEMPAAAEGYQRDNWALATAMLRHQSAVKSYDATLAAGRFNWPGRFQRMSGRLVQGLKYPVMLDGAHNAAGASLIANRPAYERFFATGRPILMAGILANRDPQAILVPFEGLIERFIALPIPGHEHHAPETLAAAANNVFGRSDSIAAATIETGFATLRELEVDTHAIVMGSLYLVGEILRLSGEVPD